MSESAPRVRVDDLVVAAAEPLAAAQALTRNVLRLRAKLCAPPPRMSELLGRCGLKAVFADVPGEPEPADALTPPAAAGRLGDGFALGVPFGALSAGELETAVALAERWGDGTLRLSPWRALVVREVADPCGLAAAARTAGFIVDPADPRLGISACAGAPACASAHAPVRAHAALAGQIPLAGRLHISGCAKGCAQPGSAAVTLVATADGYALIRQGRAGDPPAARGLSLTDVLQLLAAEAP